jgi:hypothetical protein
VDLWEDVEEQYADVIMTNEECKIGKTWWDGEKEMADYYILRKPKLTP